ncbi:hypothetical protein DL769_003609 [Monosporascus sp. CRB-8-3]|nr:hypothetical protein DL769_003609 [Monosporascus sp. CRB-8-3]
MSNTQHDNAPDTGPVPSGVASPDPLLGPSHQNHGVIDRKALARALSQNQRQNQTQDSTDHDEVLLDPMLELGAIRSRRAESIAGHRPSQVELADEAGSPAAAISQGVPPELPNLLAEIVFVLVCSAGQVVFALTHGHTTVAQFPLRDALGIEATQAPWLVGSSLLASGLSVIIAGSLADLAPPKPLMVGAFLWQAAWNGVAAGVVVRPGLRVLFFVARAMQGLSVGVLVSASMSVLGRVYKPGIRKTRVFSAMAAASPLGFWVGCMQGGALSASLPWVFGTTSIFLSLCAVAAQMTLPDLNPAKDSADADAPSLHHFDYLGATLSAVGCGGAWQFYAIQFWQRYQGATPLTVALYMLPNAIVGILAAWIVSKTLHVFPGHWIFIASMVCFALGPAFFLPQTPTTSYWALSMPGVALATFGPDLSFAAAAIFITSSVPRSYQGSAGALLVTVQNLTSAIITSVSDTIGVKISQLPSGEIGLEGLRAIWWFGLASSLTGALITTTFVRIPKAEEKEHVL